MLTIFNFFVCAYLKILVLLNNLILKVCTYISYFFFLKNVQVQLFCIIYINLCIGFNLLTVLVSHWFVYYDLIQLLFFLYLPIVPILTCWSQLYNHFLFWFCLFIFLMIFTFGWLQCKGNQKQIRRKSKFEKYFQKLHGGKHCSSFRLALLYDCFFITRLIGIYE